MIPISPLIWFKMGTGTAKKMCSNTLFSLHKYTWIATIYFHGLHFRYSSMLFFFIPLRILASSHLLSFYLILANLRVHTLFSFHSRKGSFFSSLSPSTDADADGAATKLDGYKILYTNGSQSKSWTHCIISSCKHTHTLIHG